jgi:hypothetical protein
MFLRSTVLLGVLVFILTLLGVSLTAESQAPQANSPQPLEKPNKEWAIIEGFRSAKFGMNEKQVMQTIAKDFRVSKNRVRRAISFADKTTSLMIQIPKLIEVGGPADIVYILGYKSKKLLQVNIDWGKGISEGTNGQEVVDAGNLLRKHFAKKRYKDDGYALNVKISDRKIVLFRGQDKKSRTILLRMEVFKPKGKANQTKGDREVSLLLSYIDNLKKPDVLSTETK